MWRKFQTNCKKNKTKNKQRNKKKKKKEIHPRSSPTLENPSTVPYCLFLIWAPDAIQSPSSAQTPSMVPLPLSSQVLAMVSTALPPPFPVSLPGFFLSSIRSRQPPSSVPLVCLPGLQESLESVLSTKCNCKYKSVNQNLGGGSRRSSSAT